MGWTLRLGEVAGIRVQVHFTFLIFMGWIVLSGVFAGQTQQVVLANTAFMLALFGCVVLHEFGHALTAKHYGILTKDITLLPIGGVARLERIPDDPRQELWVALAGPAVNVTIAAMLGIWLQVTRGGLNMGQIDFTSATFAERIFLLNISLALFNMLPAFPMDGGRVLRALLARRLEYTRATQIAASMGRSMALLLGVTGFFYNPMLMFIALFVWIGAGQEASMVLMKAALNGIRVSAAMVTRFDTVTPGDSLDQVSSLLLSGSQHDFPVVEGGQVVGVLTREDLMKGLARSGHPSVSQVMHGDVAVAEASELLETALRRLQESACSTMPVLQDKRLVGLLTAENLGEFVMIRNASDCAQSPRADESGSTVATPHAAVRSHRPVCPGIPLGPRPS
jgi:Zn-dependent protease/CBS domain-containing protein